LKRPMDKLINNDNIARFF